MNRKLVLGVVLFFSVVGISLVADQPQAMGGWWHRAANCGGCWGGGYVGYSGCYTPCSGYTGYTGCYGGWGGCYGYAGCSGWTGWGGGWGGCGGWSACNSCAPCGGVVVGTVSGCCGDGVSDGKVVPNNTPQDGEVKQQPTPAAPAPKPDAAPANGASASLNLSVPNDAKVVINDHVTKSVGEARRYVSRGLEPNMEYQFTIRAEVVRNGEKVERTKVVTVRANDSVDVNFEFQAPQVASVVH